MCQILVCYHHFFFPSRVKVLPLLTLLSGQLCMVLSLEACFCVGLCWSFALTVHNRKKRSHAKKLKMKKEGSNLRHCHRFLSSLLRSPSPSSKTSYNCHTLLLSLSLPLSLFLSLQLPLSLNQEKKRE